MLGAAGASIEGSLLSVGSAYRVAYLLPPLYGRS